MITARRIISILAALVAVLVATGWDACRPEARPPETQLLRYVPADTMLFAGVTQAAWARELGPGSGLYPYLLEWLGTDASRAAGEFGPAAGVLTALLRAQRTAVQRGERPLAAHGAPSDAVMAAYTVGQSPVLRWQLADRGRFWQSVDAAERRAGTEARTERRDQMVLRRYPFDSPDGTLQLVLATGGGFAVAALHAPNDEHASLDALLGLERPPDPLDRAVLEDLARSYALVPGTVAFVDNERLLAPLSDGGSGSLIGRIARVVRAANIRLHPWLVDLGTPACREQVLLIGDYWSRTVFGMTSFDPASRRVEQRVAFETPNQRGLAALETLQGRIPALVQASETVLGLGLGVDFAGWISQEQEREGEATAAESEADASEARGDRSSCPPVAALQRRGSAEGPSRAVRRLLAHTEGAGASVFRTPPAAGRARRPGAASALMVTTDAPEEVRAALGEIAALESGADRQHAPVPWRSVRRSGAEAPEEGLLLSQAPLVLAQPPAGSDEAAATNGLLSFRYRHGVSARATVAALDPWLAPLPEAQRGGVRRAVRAMDRVPFDLALDVRVGERGIELDIAISPDWPQDGPRDGP